MNSPECLSDDDVHLFAEGRLSGDRLADAERHLATCSDCPRLVADAARAPDVEHEASASPTREPEGPLAAGARVGRYVVQRTLGEGAMGRVYAALDPDLDRLVALKVLYPRLAADDLEARLRREAKAMARVTHAEVITIYDAGRHDDRLFIAMELVEGGTLRQWLRASPRSWREVLGVFARAGHGLAQAHAVGVVHRDFKPDNVLIGADGRVRITDFGLARTAHDPAASADSTHDDLDETAQHSGSLTRTGALVGTPAYMAPQQLLGVPADARADLYAFGVAIYEGLYGERPFDSGSLATNLEAKRLERIRPAPANSDVPLRVRSVVLAALRTRPEDRVASIDALLVALDRAARPPRAPWIVAGLVAAIAALATIAVTARHRVAPLPSSSSESAPTAPSPLPSAWIERSVDVGRSSNGAVFDLSPSGSRYVFADGADMWLGAFGADATTTLPISVAGGNLVGLAFVSETAIEYAVALPDESTELWRLDLGGRVATRLRVDAFHAAHASISPDGRRFAYTRHGDVHFGSVDAPSDERVAVQTYGVAVFDAAWSPASDAIVFLVGDANGTSARLVRTNAQGEHTTVLLRDQSLISNVDGHGIAFAGPDRLLVLRYGEETTLEAIGLDERGAIEGAAQVVHRWRDASISGLRGSPRRVLFSGHPLDGQLLQVPLAASSARATVTLAAGPLRPLGFLDDGRVIALEERPRITRVVVVGHDGVVAPYFDASVSSAWLVPGGDVLYWSATDTGACVLRRYVARDGTERPAAQAGTSCDAPIVCAASRCLAEQVEGSETTVREWNADVGATGAPILREDGPDVRLGLSPDGRWALTSAHIGAVTLYDLAQSPPRPQGLPTPLRFAQSFGMGTDARTFVLSGYDANRHFETIAVDRSGASRVLASDPTVWWVNPRIAQDGRSFVVGRRDFGSRLSELEAQ